MLRALAKILFPRLYPPPAPPAAPQPAPVPVPQDLRNLTSARQDVAAGLVAVVAAVSEVRPIAQRAKLNLNRIADAFDNAVLANLPPDLALEFYDLTAQDRARKNQPDCPQLTARWAALGRQPEFRQAERLAMKALATGNAGSMMPNPLFAKP